MTTLRDPEVRLLACIASTLEANYTTDDHAWKGSPFAWIRSRPSRQRGKIGEQLVAGWLAARGFNVTRSTDSDADKVVENKRIEIKFSTLWKTGVYKFQQIRDQRYDILICLGVSPFDAHCWALDKPEVLKRRRRNDIPPQHTGAAGSDTAWLTVNPQAPPSWLHDHGGSLSQGLARLVALTGFQPSRLR